MSEEKKQEKELEQRKEKIKSFLKDNYNLALFLIILVAFLVRIYFFIVTKNQPLWWDEAEYGAMAKYFAHILPAFDVNAQRPMLYPGILALFFKLNLSEMVIKFISVLIPSTLIVYATYYLGKEMYDKKIALIASAFVTFSWTLLFWTERLQPDFTSLLFQCLAIAFMWR